jgi:glycosyltransferase involved in cell wall biosynthesis
MIDRSDGGNAVDSKPLVTFALFAYNQEQFIREAIGGAFSQTYSPLEIILSDDCSSDKTFAIMKEMAAAYPGPHAVRVRASAKNRGFAEHINDVMREVRGEFIVLAAGDDVSNPARVERLVDERLQHECKIMCIYSDVSTINTEGAIIQESGFYLDRSGDDLPHFIESPFWLGPSYAFDLAVHRELGPLLSDLRNEDYIFPFRTLLLGGRVAYINESLVRYRIDVGHRRDEIRMRPTTSFLLEYRRKEIVFNQMKTDLQKKSMDQLYRAVIEKHLSRVRCGIQLASKNVICKLLICLNMLVRDPRGMIGLLRSFIAIGYPKFFDRFQRMKN